MDSHGLVLSSFYKTGAEKGSPQTGKHSRKVRIYTFEHYSIENYSCKCVSEERKTSIFLWNLLRLVLSVFVVKERYASDPGFLFELLFDKIFDIIQKSFFSMQCMASFFEYIGERPLQIMGGEQMEDRQIVDLYWAREEAAIHETAVKYGSYCHSIAYAILQNQQDADESVNDTYLDAWNAMPPNRPSVLVTFLGKITRRIAIDRWRIRSAKKRGGNAITFALEELDECVRSSLENGILIAYSAAAKIAKAVATFFVFISDSPWFSGNSITLNTRKHIPPGGILRRYYNPGNAVCHQQFSQKKRPHRTHFIRWGRVGM